MFFITDQCKNCGICSQECPMEAIDQGLNRYVIRQDDCILCGACLKACPSDAVTEA